MKRLFLIVCFCTQVVVAQQVKFFHTFGHGIYDSGEGVLQSLDTGYVVGGITTQTGSNGTDMLIYKSDSLGVLQWYKNIGLDNSIEGARSIAGGISGNGYLLAGYQNKFDTAGYNFYVVKTDLNGDTLWTRVYGGPDWEMAYSVDTLKDSTYVIAGETYSYGNGNLDMYVIKIDEQGDTLWTRTFGGSNDDYARYVYVDKYNNIMVVGTTLSFGAGGSDVYIVYLNTLGDTIWTRTYGTAVDEYGYSGDMYINNGGFLSFSYAFTRYNPLQSAQDGRLMRLDSTGVTLVTDIPVFASNPQIYDHVKMRRGDKGRFYHTGDIKYSPTGQTDIYVHYTLYGMVFGLDGFVTGTDFEWPRDIRRCFDKGYILTGETKTYGPGPSASFIIKLDSMLSTVATALVDVEDVELVNFTVYPNPVINQIIYVEAGYPIKLATLYDMNGRALEVIQGQHSPSQQLNIDPFPNGMYILEIKTDHGVGRKKLLINHY